MQEIDKKQLWYNIVAITITLMVTMLLFKADDPYGGILILFTSLLIFKPIRHSRFSFIDISACLLWLYSLLSCFSSMNPFPAWQVSYNSTVCFCGYILLRKILSNSRSNSLFLQSIGLLTGIVVCLSILSFYIYEQSVKDVGFVDTYPFRFLFRPLGYITNVWSAVLIPLLGLASIGGYVTSEKRFWPWFFLLLLCLTIFSILLSFSRGAYIALCVYVVFFFLFVNSNKEKIKLLVSCVLIGGLIYGTYPSETMTTLRMNKTVSQQQSNEGRMDATQIALDIFQQERNNMMGFGNGNYTLAIDKKANQDSNNSYTSYAPNFVTQLLIEQGLIGLLLYTVLIIGIIVKLWRQRNDAVCIIAGGTLIAVFVKELTLSTLLSVPIITFLCYILLALLQRKKKEVTERLYFMDIWMTYMIYGIICLFYICFEYQYVRQERNNSYNLNSLSAFEKGNYQKAIRLIEQTDRQVPYLINRGVLYMDCYSNDPQSEYLRKAREALTEAKMLNTDDIHIDYLLAKLLVLQGSYSQAYSEIRKMVNCFPDNSLYQFELSRLLYNTGKKREAAVHLENAIYLTPGILNMDSVRKQAQADSGFYHLVVERLLDRYPNASDSPATFARYGYITYYNGHIQEAKKNLSYALSVLPNLFTPWFLLGKIYAEENKIEKADSCFRKHRLLVTGAFNFQPISSIPLERDLRTERELFVNYAVKFGNWYNCRFFGAKGM